MKIVLYGSGILAVGLAFCWAVGLVEFTYLNVVPNEPLRHPCKVTELNDTNMVLESGDIVGFRPRYTSYSDLSNQLVRSDFEVDIEPTKGRLDIYVRRYSKFRDTVPPFTIPLIRKTVGRKHRELVAFGVYVSTNSQPDGAANRSRPIRSETNRAAAAAGPGR